MATTRTLLISFLLFQANFAGALNHSYSLHVPKKSAYRYGPMITACIALPLSGLFFYRAMKAFDERKAIMESIPGLEDYIKLLQKKCAEFNDPEDEDIYLAIHWTNLYDIRVREYDPVRADKLLELRMRESCYMIPGFILAAIGVSTGFVALSD